MLVFIVQSNISVVRFIRSGTDCCRPALDTRISSPPRPAMACSTSFCRTPLRADRLESRRICVRLLDQRNHFLRVRLLDRKVVDCNIGTLARIRNRCRASHARVAPRDQRLAPHQPSRALVAGLTMIQLWCHLACEPRPGLWLHRKRRPRILGRRVRHRLPRGCLRTSRFHSLSKRRPTRRSQTSHTQSAHHFTPRHTFLLRSLIHHLPALGVSPTETRCVRLHAHAPGPSI